MKRSPMIHRQVGRSCMARAIVLSNGEFMVCLDDYGYIRDIYYPYVGLYNHVVGFKHRIGVYVDQKLTWLDDPSWKINVGYKKETMVARLVCKNEDLNISLVIENAVYNEANVFMRKVDI